MASKFDKAFNAVIKLNEIPQNVHKDINDDIDTIANGIYEKLKGNDSIFKDMFKELKATATYTKNTTFEIPVDYSNELNFVLPFKVQTKFLTADHDNLLLQTNVNHPIVENGYINAKRFEMLLQCDLNTAITIMKPIKCAGSGSERNYKLKVIWEETVGCCIIKATEEINETAGVGDEKQLQQQQQPAIITYTFKPVLKFLTKDYPIKCKLFENAKYWLAYHEVGMDEHILSTEVPRWQVTNRQDRLKMRDVLRLCALFFIKTQLFENYEMSIKFTGHGLLQVDETPRFETTKPSDMFTYLILCNRFKSTKFYDTEITDALKKNRKQVDKLTYFMVTDEVRIKDLLVIFGLL